MILSLIALAIWSYLLACRGGFWLARERDDVGASAPAVAAWPSVTAVIPARDEADVITRSVGSLLAQDYAGELRIVVVDDQSSDGTAEAARALNSSGRLEILRGVERPSGWTGKPWALKQGIGRAGAGQRPDFFWFTDADIVHSPDNLRRLVERLERDNLVMVSLMAKLRCESFAERLLIPAFAYFFEMLFPFSWVNSRDVPVAAAAGGCILVRREALERAGGIDSVRHEIIDDCALGRRLKAEGAIWLGLTERATSLRGYQRVRDVERMVARSAFAELDYSTARLVGTIAGMAATFAVAPLVLLLGAGEARAVAALVWLCMAVSFQPMLRFYRLTPLWGVALPFIALFYTAFTLSSAIQFWSGRGGIWKGRIQAMKQT